MIQCPHPSDLRKAQHPQGDELARSGQSHLGRQVPSDLFPDGLAWEATRKRPVSRCPRCSGMGSSRPIRLETLSGTDPAIGLLRRICRSVEPFIRDASRVLMGMVRRAASPKA
jgi:hypothetical protein